MTDYNVSEWNENIRRADEVESLREQKDTREMERNMAEEAAASFKERAEAAEAKLAEAEEQIRIERERK